MENVIADEIEQFYGVYLLYCTNPKYLGRVYIGFTVDPNRRIKQHNKGKKNGGAWKTSNRGPWTMVMIIHGFPNDVTALRFEWAWQHPYSSRRLRHVPRKRSKEKVIDFKLRVLSEMLLVGPWNRLPLTIRWLNEDFMKTFPNEKPPPRHMPICYGPVISKKLPKPSTSTNCDNSNRICDICKCTIFDECLKCLNFNCDLVSHVVCLANIFLDNKNEYVPIEGTCPKCNNTYLWGDIIRKFKGCYSNLDMKINTDGNGFYSSDSD